MGRCGRESAGSLKQGQTGRWNQAVPRQIPVAAAPRTRREPGEPPFPEVCRGAQASAGFPEPLPLPPLHPPAASPFLFPWGKLSLLTLFLNFPALSLNFHTKMSFSSYLTECSPGPPTWGSASEGLNLGSYLGSPQCLASLPVGLRDIGRRLSSPSCHPWGGGDTSASDLTHPCTSFCLLKEKHTTCGL